MKDFLDQLYIPPPPSLFADIKRAGGELDKISSVIKKDPELAAKVLQSINSAAFGMYVHIASIPHAVSLLGLESVLNIINGVLLRQISDKVDYVDLQIFWENSNEVGSYAAYTSRKLSIGQPDEMFTLGLFHNCGIPVILQKYENYFSVLRKGYANANGLIRWVEEKLLQCNHAEVSYLVSRAWNLPNHIIDAIRYHHDIIYFQKLLQTAGQSSDPHDTKVLNSMVVLKIAEHLAELHLVLGNQEVDFEWELLKGPIMEYCKFDEATLQDLEEQINEKFRDIEKEK